MLNIFAGMAVAPVAAQGKPLMGTIGNVTRAAPCPRSRSERQTARMP